MTPAQIDRYIAANSPYPLLRGSSRSTAIGRGRQRHGPIVAIIGHRAKDGRETAAMSIAISDLELRQAVSAEAILSVRLKHAVSCLDRHLATA